MCTREECAQTHRHTCGLIHSLAVNTHRELWNESGLIDERFPRRSPHQPISDSYGFDGSLVSSSLVPPSFDLFSPSAVTPAVLRSPCRQRFKQTEKSLLWHAAGNYVPQNRRKQNRGGQKKDVRAPTWRGLDHYRNSLHKRGATPVSLKWCTRRRTAPQLFIDLEFCSQ